MNVPLEILYRNVGNSEDVDKLIRSKVGKLEQICDHITSCRVAVERRHQHQQSGNPFRVRIDIRVPPGHELVVKRISTEGEREESLPVVLRRAFEATRRQLKRLVERQRGEVKIHPQQQVMALVERLFTEDGYGFLRTLDGRQMYFHKNSVLHGDFECMEIGTGVRFVEEMGREGLQATTVEIVGKPGSRIPKAEQSGGLP